jgi:uncharacterized protein
VELRGRRVLITGASRGLGESLAHAFAGAGSTVALVARSVDPITKLAAELDGTAHSADLGDPAQVRGLLHRVEEEAGPVDVLVNNAGVDATGPFAEMTEEELRQLTQIDYLTPADLCRQAIPRMARRGGGHLVNVSSLSGVAPFPGLAAYSASKAALSQLTAGLRADLKGTPVRTTLVELGPMPSEMLDHVKSYLPTERSFRRFYRLRLLTEVDREVVAAAVVDAVAKDRRHVRLPKRAAPLPLLTEVPRRTVELLLAGVPHQPKRK